MNMKVDLLGHIEAKWMFKNTSNGFFKLSSEKDWMNPPLSFLLGLNSRGQNYW